MTECAVDHFEEIFSEKGLLRLALPRYEPREDQRKMAEAIWRAFESQQTALFEAGTGIGKSIAYLIPALLWSQQTGEKVVISTYTIALQQQLIEKDIPQLMNALGLNLKVIVAKGMGNYVCMRKLEEAPKDDTLHLIEGWARYATTGSKSDLPTPVNKEQWKEINAESDSCNYVKCPHYKQCFFFKSRRKVEGADVIIVNHHLLMSHLLAEENQPILPPFSRLIVDEAHHLEAVGRHSLTQVLDRVHMYRQLAKVHTDSHPETSRLFALRDAIKTQNDQLKQQLDRDIPGEKRVLLTKIQHAFDRLEAFIEGQDARWRLTPSILESRVWQKEITPAFMGVKEELCRMRASLAHIETVYPEDLKEKMSYALADIQGQVQAIDQIAQLIDSYFTSFDPNQVRWAQREATGANLLLAELDVAPFLQKQLFASLQTAILCSATLTVGTSFSHLKEAIGLEETDREYIYASPFDFLRRTKLLGISDLPPPNGYTFVQEAAKVIDRVISISGGGVFVLFTSFEMLKACAKRLSHLPLLVQGEGSRSQLLEEFKSQKNGILLGTDSFWEGVDVAGTALRLVIIVKLPFPVPSDPLLQAKAEHLKSLGRDPFNEDSVPQAVMKFKQGFGRLMRDQEDRGCVLCLDQRLFTKGYGKAFIKSLPECPISYQTREKIFSEMEQFYM